MELVLVFPDQLFAEHPAFAQGRDVLVVEEPLYFGDEEFALDYHAQKLLFHRQSIDGYVERVTKAGGSISVASYFHDAPRTFLADVLCELDAGTTLHVCELADDVLTRRIHAACDLAGHELVWHDSPGFLLNANDVTELLGKPKRYFMAKFYERQRKRFDILMRDGKPEGGKWSFDADNRKKLPRKIEIPTTTLAPSAPGRAQRQWLDTVCPDAIGSAAEFWWPSTPNDAQKALDEFLDERFGRYGDYQDAISDEHVFVFHSVLSPFLNSGLLTPAQVLDAVLERAEQGDIPMNALEGFVRQLIGWREYIRGVYDARGRFQRSRNFFEFTHAMPPAILEARTGIDPLDAIVKRVNDHAWCHHIERLMVLGNFMLLCEIDPDEVYRYFMGNFIDAYDWVMVPNVYGMSQYSDGGLMCTKPYISGSNYIRKMSNFSKGPWCEVWDALFWRFVERQRPLMSSNPRMTMMVRMLDRMDADKKTSHMALAERWLQALHADRIELPHQGAGGA